MTQCTDQWSSENSTSDNIIKIIIFLLKITKDQLLLTFTNKFYIQADGAIRGTGSNFQINLLKNKPIKLEKIFYVWYSTWLERDFTKKLSLHSILVIWY